MPRAESAIGVPERGTMLHLLKLSVGTRDIADLRAWQAERARADAPLRHRTRNFPRRADEVVAGGSIYWVIAGVLLARQRVIDIIEDCMEDGSACAGIVLDHAIVPVAGRRMKPFQGWRYLAAGDAPPDIGARERASGEQALPPELARELRVLCLI